MKKKIHGETLKLVPKQLIHILPKTHSDSITKTND